VTPSEAVKQLKCEIECHHVQVSAEFPVYDRAVHRLSAVSGIQRNCTGVSEARHRASDQSNITEETWTPELISPNNSARITKRSVQSPKDRIPADSGGSPSGAYTSGQRWLAVSRLHQWTAVARRLARTPVDSGGSPSGAYTRRCDINIAELPSTPGGPQ